MIKPLPRNVLQFKAGLKTEASKARVADLSASTVTAIRQADRQQERQRELDRQQELLLENLERLMSETYKCLGQAAKFYIEAKHSIILARVVPMLGETDAQTKELQNAVGKELIIRGHNMITEAVSMQGADWFMQDLLRK